MTRTYTWRNFGVPSGTNEYRNLQRKAMRKEGKYKPADEKKLKYLRRWKMMKRYGLTVERYDEMLLEQDGKCAICGTTGGKYEEAKNCGLSIDHCHDTGTVRGLLCNKCNVGIGNFNDDSTLITKAAEYLA